ncbi:hypothetical protein ACHAPU_007150 [Fusarium lateritium]
MQFSLVTVIAALSATASGWTMKAYNTRGCGDNSNPADVVFRQLDSPLRAECMTFGRDMPNVGCFEQGADGTRDCSAAEFLTRSIRVDGACLFYAGPDCEGEAEGELAITSLHSETCVESDFEDSPVQSYFCWADDSVIDHTK